MKPWLRDILARYGLPAAGMAITAGINAAYLNWPVLDGLGLPREGVLTLLNGVLVAVAGHLNLHWDDPNWTNK